MQLPTAAKIALARAVYRATTALRYLSGRKGTAVVCRRDGLSWQLDLAEGFDLAIYLNLFERDTRRALARLASPGMVVLDVGANVGGHTLPLAAAVGSAGRVVAIEPTAWAFAKLTHNLALNPDLEDRVVAVQAALTGPDLERPQAFFSSWSLASRDADAHPVHHGSLRTAAGARALTLDQLVAELGLPRVDLIKLDVDGFEIDVLSGAGDTLARYRPPLVMELCEYVHGERGKSLDELIAILSSFDYRLLRERDGAPLPEEVSQLRGLIPEGGAVNIVAAPDAGLAEKL